MGDANPIIIPTKFICQSCGGKVNVSRKEALKAARIRCMNCGGTRLEPVQEKTKGD